MAERMTINEKILASFLPGEKLLESERMLYQKSFLGREVEQSAKVLTKILTSAIKENEIGVLFEFERLAIERDTLCYGADEKRLNMLGSLTQAARLVQETRTAEGAKAYLLELNGGKGLPAKIPSSDLVQNFLKNQKAQLSQMISATSSPALKLYRARRKEALEHIRKQYVIQLNRGLGKEIDNDKGLSR